MSQHYFCETCNQVKPEHHQSLSSRRFYCQHLLDEAREPMLFSMGFKKFRDQAGAIIYLLDEDDAKGELKGMDGEKMLSWIFRQGGFGVIAESFSYWGACIE